MTTAHDPVSIVYALDEACNAHDLAAVMVLFAKEAVVRQTPAPDGVGVYRGKEQIRSWLEWQLPGFHVDSRDHQASGDTVHWSAAVTNDMLRQLGLNQPTMDHNEAVVRGGKIVSFTVTSQALIARADVNVQREPA